MLEAVAEFQRAESDGNIGEPLDERDQGLPYYSLARTYAKSADAARAISVLKVLQAKKIPMTRETHRIRLEALLRTPARRRNPTEVERAFHDLLVMRPKDGPLMQSRLANMIKSSLGEERYSEIIAGHGADEKLLVPDLPDSEAKILFRRANAMQSLIKYRPGKDVISRKYEDERFFNKRQKSLKSSGPAMGKVTSGTRVEGERGLPEWMQIPEPQAYGK